ncbi:hypothetical protein GJAV_G00271180 [Gymnothorax javanicus]|nr:hypothetical protein GJAV_G00271180 [Gymnothorax javanicus]
MAAEVLTSSPRLSKEPLECGHPVKGLLKRSAGCGLIIKGSELLFSDGMRQVQISWFRHFYSSLKIPSGQDDLPPPPHCSVRAPVCVNHRLSMVVRIQACRWLRYSVTDRLMQRLAFPGSRVRQKACRLC